MSMANALQQLVVVLGWGAGAVYALWLFFLATMSIMRAWRAQTLKPVAMMMAAPILLVALVLDVAVNVLVATVVFVAWPQEWLVTRRLVRYIDKPQGWRTRLALWGTSHLLDMFDPSGLHRK
jgi:hypothetical protein